MMQFRTYFWRFRQCQLNFMPFASTLHAAVAFSRVALSALDSFAASAGTGMNAMPLTSTVAIVPAIKAVAKWYMIRSLELLVHYCLAVEIGAATPNRREDAEPDEIVREVTRNLRASYHRNQSGAPSSQAHAGLALFFGQVNAIARVILPRLSERLEPNRPELPSSWLKRVREKGKSGAGFACATSSIVTKASARPWCSLASQGC
jgi:hypothetical protein